MARHLDVQVGGWKFMGHMVESSQRLIVQVEVHDSVWVNIVVERSDDGCTHQLFDFFLDEKQAASETCETLLRHVLGSCHERYEHGLPLFGNTLFLVDVEGRPSVVEELDPAILAALPTADSLFGNRPVPVPVVPRSEVQGITISRSFFLPQTRPVSYHGTVFVGKGPASAARAIEDLAEAVKLSSLPSGHPHILPPPAALLQVSDKDDRICGFLIPFYENGNLDSYARKLREANDLTPGRLRSWFHQLVSAVSFLMAAGTWHGDIKPDNVVVDSSGDLVLIDLSGKYTTTAIASPEVMQAARQRGSLEVPSDWPMADIEKAEVYSIGRTMFFLSEGISMMDIYNNPESPHASETAFTDSSSMYADLRELILTCVEEDPSHRPDLKKLASYIDAI